MLLTPLPLKRTVILTPANITTMTITIVIPMLIKITMSSVYIKNNVIKNFTQCPERRFCSRFSRFHRTSYVTNSFIT